MLELVDKGQPTAAHPHPLLFVHGAFLGAWSWEVHFLDFFADRGFRVLAPSLRGHGASPADKPLRLCSIADFVEDVTTIANTIAPQPVPIGHSMGGFVVQKYLEANEAPAAVLLASAPSRGHLRSLLRNIRRHPWRSSRFSLTGRPDHLLGTTTAGARELFFGQQASDDLIRSTTARLQPDSTRAILLDMVAVELVRTDRITTPFLVRGGEEDATYPPTEVRATARAYGTEATIIPQIGHSMTVEPGWETVAERIVSWLTQRGL